MDLGRSSRPILFSTAYCECSSCFQNFLTSKFLYYKMLISVHACRFVALPLAFVCLVLLLSFPGWHTVVNTEANPEGSEADVKPFLSRAVALISLSIISISSIFSFISILWQHIASAVAATTTQSLSYGSVKGQVGASAMVLGWVSVALIMVVTVALVPMVFSIRVSSELAIEPETHSTADQETQSQRATLPQPPQLPQQISRDDRDSRRGEHGTEYQRVRQQGMGEEQVGKQHRGTQESEVLQRRAQKKGEQQKGEQQKGEQQRESRK